MTETIPLETRLNYIEKIITADKFRSNRGLGNDIPYYIFDYDPKDEIMVRDYLKTLVPRINGANLGFEVVVFDLYRIIHQIIEEKGYDAKCAELEVKHGREQLEKAVSTMLRLTSTESPIIIHIKENTPKDAVVFLTGIGTSFPILRAHNILNNLQQVLDTVPVIMFYPGKYTGQELQLFGTMKDDNYYRAFPFPRPEK